MTTADSSGIFRPDPRGAGPRQDSGPAHGEGEEEEEGPTSADDASSDLSALVVPYPELAPVVFFCLKQTTCPRNWCIRMVCNPYPFRS
uniref:Voltage-dependent T-type calcium channel subunit alpha-1G n=2 Tax=Lepisosteus oculatus TaxID=7918 RepID=W5NMU0_LEPOC